MPLVLQATGARSIVDVGCGVGAWLAACAQLGITDYLGLDGDYATTLLQIPQEHFQTADLSKPFTIPGRSAFDLAMSLEVAEHLPADTGPIFVQQLTRTAPMVLFSAAIPGQGGARHINERWPSYWVGLFEQHGYFPVDTIRPLIWNHPGVEWWYRQNILLYLRHDRLPAHYVQPAMLNVVHPELFTGTVTELDDAQHISGREGLKAIISSIGRRAGLMKRE